jgi:diguanylate cyclase (GGDEF)-like protein
MPKSDALSSERLERLARRIARLNARVIPVTTSTGRQARGLAIVLDDLESPDVRDIVANADLSLPLSSDDLKTLDALRDLIEENKTLKELSITDNLTGLYNRRYFREQLAIEIERVKRTEKPCALLMIDLDKFKPVNDQYGHQTGDDILKVAAEIIRQGTRSVDIPVRYGGDEFAVILPGTGLVDGHRLAERIRLRLERDPRTAKYNVTGSFGLAGIYNFESGDAYDLVEWADNALYQAKKRGGNQVAASDIPSKEEHIAVTVAERDDLDFNRLVEDESG